MYDSGRFVLSAKDIYRSLGLGIVRKVKGDQAKIEFNPTVFSDPPYRSENKILKLTELRPVKPPLELANKSEWGEAWRFDLKQRAAMFLTNNKGGQLSNARTEILPHQIFTAHKVITSPHRRFMLADEVGLGKTIEAGMIWQALLQRGQARRTLIVCPAGLTLQWQEELWDKFKAHFEIFGRDFTAIYPRMWDLKAHAIASLDTLKNKNHKETLLENRRWDLIIFDEAHKLSAIEYESGKREKTIRFKLAEDLKDHTDALLLLTGTPHQGEENHSRFKHLLGLLGQQIDFSKLEDSLSLLSLMETNGGIPYYDLILRTPKSAVTDSEGKKVFKGRITHPRAVNMYADERRFYDAVELYIRRGYNAIELISERHRRRALGFVLTTFQKLNASSTRAIKASLRKRQERIKEQLADLGPIEEEPEDERYLGEWEVEQALKSQEAFLEDEIAQIDALLAMEVKRDRKMTELMDLLDDIDKESPLKEKEKVLIFTEYRETQEHLIQELELRSGKGSVVVIKGGMKVDEKRAVQRRFKSDDRVRFLVSTEAGGEGINLQFCHICVNYDLPWNPMRVEQRVGRIYRFGQDKVVQVYNFSNKKTIEETVRSYFERRVIRAAQALSQVTKEDEEGIRTSLLGQMEGLVEYDRIYRRALVEEDLNKQSKEELSEAVKQAHKAYEIATTSLFRDVSSYSFDRFRKELATTVSLSDIQDFTERFLHKHRRVINKDGDRWSFLTPEGLKGDHLKKRYNGVTFNRSEAIADPDLEFFAIGHELVDAMFKNVGDYDFGGNTARRILKSKERRSRSGIQFNFIVRTRVERDEGTEYLFDYHPVVVGEDYKVDLELAKLAVEQYTSDEAKDPSTAAMSDIERAYTVAKEYVEREVEDLWDWDEDVQLLNVAFVSVI